MPQNVMCKNCNRLKNHWCKAVLDSPVEDMLRDCRHFMQKTNADRIRAMSDEELAVKIYAGVSSDPCDYCPHNNHHCNGSPCMEKADVETIIAWLQQPAEEVQE